MEAEAEGSGVATAAMLTGTKVVIGTIEQEEVTTVMYDTSPVAATRPIEDTSEVAAVLAVPPKARTEVDTAVVVTVAAAVSVESVPFWARITPVAALP